MACYRRMSPETTIKWVLRQKEAGAKCTVMGSDQFLGRVLFPGGREEILEIIELHQRHPSPQL